MSGPRSTEESSRPDPGKALVVIPTYNERELLPQIAEAILGLPGAWNLLIADDGSPDGTGELADGIAAREPRVTVLHRPEKQGLGPAYLAAFGEALQRPEVHFIGQIDADFSHNPADLPRLLEALAEAELAIGSRYVPGGGTQGWGLRRRLLSRWGNAYVRLVLGAEVRDLTAGFRMWRRGALEAIDLEAVKTRGYGFQIEMAVRAAAAGCRVVEVPIIFTERRAGKSKMSGGIVTEALALPWKLRRLP
ncbi:MAG TPA: polyprenol monophosphomannose synthase [Armatimonadota bacterium]|nr:polyprenol monophosphomannose synthase [Armatimonadota bacterium]